MVKLIFALATVFSLSFPQAGVVQAQSAGPSIAGTVDHNRPTIDTSAFVFHKGQLISSSCDASPSFPIAMTAAYPDAARLAYPIRTDLQNGVVLTVRWQEPTLEMRKRGPNMRVVTEVIEVGGLVGCDVTPGDRPFQGTIWAEIQGEKLREHGWRLLFTPGGFRGNDGCNAAQAPYQLVGSQVTLGLIMKTMVACRHQTYDCPGQRRSPPRDQDWLEANVVYTFTIHGRTMQLRPASGEPRTFIASEWD